MAPEPSARPLPIILALGTTQTLAWASSYYLPAILADPIAQDLGVSSNWIFAAFSASLVIAALLGPRIGRQIDLFGGRPVLSMSNLTLAAGLAFSAPPIPSRYWWPPGCCSASAWDLASTMPPSRRWDGSMATMRAAPSPASRCSQASQVP